MDESCKNYQSEHHTLMKIINFRLPHIYKKIGIGAALIIFLFLLFYKFYGANDLLTKDILRTIMVVFLFIATMSKEDFEDELVNHIRLQSYVLAFACAIGYSLILPLIAYVLDVLITKVSGDGTINFHETSAFEVMFMLVCFQLLFCATLKRLYRA